MSPLHFPPRYAILKKMQKMEKSMAQKKNRIHDWRKLKWPFTASFLYYALICLLTGTAEASEVGFASVLILALVIDAVAYSGYIFFLSRDEENMSKLWFVFVLAYVLATTEQLSLLWQMLAARAAA